MYWSRQYLSIDQKKVLPIDLTKKSCTPTLTPINRAQLKKKNRPQTSKNPSMNVDISETIRNANITETIKYRELGFQI